MAKPKDIKATSGSTFNIAELFMALPIFFKSKIVPLLWGHTGLGKTQIVQEYCAGEGWDCIMIYVSQLEPSDFVGLYKINEDGRTSNCPPNWLPYKTADGKVGRKIEATVTSIKDVVDFLESIPGEIN